MSDLARSHPSITSLAVRRAVHEWIREDASTGIKMMMSKELADKLLRRIYDAILTTPKTDS